MVQGLRTDALLSGIATHPLETTDDDIRRPLILFDECGGLFKESLHFEEFESGSARFTMMGINSLTCFRIIGFVEDGFAIHKFLLNRRSTFDLIIDCAVAASEGFGNETVGILKMLIGLDFDSFMQG